MKKYDHIKEGLQDWSFSCSGFRDEVLYKIMDDLVEAGIRIPDSVRDEIYQEGNALLIAELVNFSAKVLDESWYDVKAAAFVAASRAPGVQHFWSYGILYLIHKDVGEVSCHDPYGEVAKLYKEVHGEMIFSHHEWCGIRRQFNVDAIVQFPVLKRMYRDACLYDKWSSEQCERVAKRLMRDQAT